MRGIVFVVLLVAYILIGNLLAVRTLSGRRDPQRQAWGFDIFRPELFTAEGEPRRRLAVRFHWVGALVLIVAYWLLGGE